MNTKITLEGMDHAALVGAVVGRLLDETDEYESPTGKTLRTRIAEALESEAQKRMLRIVEEETRRYTNEHTRKILDGIFAEGVTRTNEYGENRRVIPWKEFVVSCFTGRDSYGQTKTTLEKIATEAAQSLLREQLAPVFAELVEKVRAQVDDIIGNRVKEAMRKAAGL